MCIVIICCSVCNVINFEINLSLLIKPFFYITKKSIQKFKYFKNKKSFSHEIKSIFIIFKGFSVVRNCLRPESGRLRIIMDLNLLSFGSLVLVAPCCVFYATRQQTYRYRRFNTDNSVFASPQTWYHTHRIHRGQYTYMQIYIYILTPTVICTQQLPVLHWTKTFTEVHNVFTV